MTKSKSSRRLNWINKARIFQAVVIISVLLVQQDLFRALVISLFKLKAMQVYFFLLKNFKIYILKN
jgi:hypothetical protein